MIEQLTMDLERAEAERERGRHVYLRLVEHLMMFRDWHTREQLKAYGYTPRMCRLARQYSEGAIISGQLGYKATACATMEEIRVAIATLGSMAEELTRERLQLQKRYHAMKPEPVTQ